MNRNSIIASTIAFVTALFIIIGIGMISYQNINRLVDNEKLTIRVHKTQIDLESILSQVKDISGRGFIMTKNEEYLVRYNEALKNIPAVLSDLHQLLQSDDDRDFNQLIILIKEREKIVATEIKIMREQGFNAVQTEILGGRNKTVMDQIRSVIASMEIVQNKLITESKRKADESADKSVWIITLGTIAAVLFLLCALFINVYSVNRLKIATVEINKINSFLNAILENIPNMIFVKDAKDLRFVLLNKEGEKLLGHSREHIIDKNDYDLFPKEQADFFTLKDRKVLNEGIVYDIAEEPVNTSFGERWLHTKKLPIVDKSGSSYLLGISEDITNRKEAEEKQKQIEATLKKSEERFSKIFYASSIPMSLVEVDKKASKFLEVNESFTQLTGCTLVELQEQGLVERNIINQAEREESYRLYKKQGYLKNMEMQLTDSRGNLKYILFSSEEVEISNKNYTLTTYYDITQRKEMEKELIAAKESAEKSAKIKEEFLANMSHEIRTPMNAIIGFADLLQNSSLNKIQQKQVHSIITSGDNLLTIINGILDYSKIEAGMMGIEKVPVNLPELFDSFSGMMAGRAESKGLEFKLITTQDLPEFILGDPKHLNQILINLVGNAIKFTEKGHVYIIVNSVEAGESNKFVLCFTVEDTGIGVSKEVQSIIFDRFSQAGSGIARQFGGTGLGLSIVKNLVEMQGGEISVDSELHKGASFKVCIPFYKLSSEQINEYKKSLEKNRYPVIDIGKINVLLVEDNPLNRELGLSVLTNFGFETTLVNNGKEAIDILYKQKFDIILMDIQMGVMDGYAATHIIRETMKITTPIIALTAYAMSSERDKCLRAGMNEYISKPYKAKELYDKIGLLISNKGKLEREKVSSVNDVKGICNLTSLLELVEGDKKAVKKIVGLFVHEVPKDLETLEKSIEEQNYKGVKAILHKVKSSFAVFGIHVLLPIVVAMEENAEAEKGLDEIKKSFMQLKEIVTEVIEELKRY